MSELFIILIPSLPTPPTEVLEYKSPWNMINSDGTTIHELGIYRQMNKLCNGKLMKCCKPASVHASDKLTNWVKDNLVSEYKALRVNYYIPLADTCNSIGIHTDKLSEFILLYNIETGGPDAATTLWQQQNFPLYREPGLSIENTVDLTKVCQVVGPTGWYLINARILHSVENVITPRINIQISLTAEQLQKNGLLNHL